MARDAPNQFRLLDAFEAAEWPDTMANPFGHNEQFHNALKYIKREMEKRESIMTFRIHKTRPGWQPRF
jgi:hypothetical protein